MLIYFRVEKKMIFHSVRCIFVFVFLVMLKLCADKAAFVMCNDNVPCTPLKLKFDLSVICGFENGGKDIPNIPSGCTAISVSRNADHLATAKLMKGKLPLVLIENSYSFTEWETKLKRKADEYINEITSYDVDVVVFDQWYDLNSVSTNYDISKDIVRFIQEAKHGFTKMQFGMILPNDMAVIELYLDLHAIKKEIHFFMIDTTIYRECEHHNHQKDMEPVAKFSDVKNTVEELVEKQIDTCQMIITIQFIVYSVKYNDFSDNEHEEMAYSRLCTKKMSVKRKYCFDSIDAIFEKAKYAYDQNMIGVYAKDLENEDPNGDCECNIEGDNVTKFPGLRIITQLKNNHNLNVDHFKCLNGDFPKIK